MRLRLLVLALAMSSSLVSDSAGAAVVLDQEHFVTPPPGSGTTSNPPSLGRSQTFTVGIAGLLDSIHAEVTLGTPTSARILATSGGAPIGGSGGSTVLATSSSVTVVGPGSLNNEIVSYDFSGSGFSVSAGDVLAVELVGLAAWLGDLNGSYAGGRDYFFNSSASIFDWTPTNADWNFRTFVQTSAAPEPSSLALLVAGLLGIAFTRRL